MPLRRQNNEKPITIMINRWERNLILHHGYPFEDIERQLKESDDADVVPVADVPFYWEQLIQNLSLSVNEKPEFQQDDRLLESVEELIEKIAIDLGLL